MDRLKSTKSKKPSNRKNYTEEGLSQSEESTRNATALTNSRIRALSLKQMATNSKAAITEKLLLANKVVGDNAKGINI